MFCDKTELKLLPRIELNSTLGITVDLGAVAVVVAVVTAVVVLVVTTAMAMEPVKALATAMEENVGIDDEAGAR